MRRTDREPVAPGRLGGENIAVLLWRRRRGWRYENAEIRAATGDVYVQLRALFASGDDVLSEEHRRILGLVNEVEKEFLVSGTISKELEDKVLAVDHSIFSQELWRKCEVWLRMLFKPERFWQERQLPIKYWQLRAMVKNIQRQTNAIHEEFVNLKYDQVAIPQGEASTGYSATKRRALDRLDRLQRRVPPPVSAQSEHMKK